MTSNDDKNYNPADDDNQGVIQPLAQATNGGFSQTGGLTIPTAQGPEPIKEEVNDGNDGSSDTDANGVNDDMLEEEDVEAGNIDVEYEEGDN